VPGVEDPDPGPACRVEHANHPFGYLRAVGELADDADLHVIDDQGHAIRVAGVREAVGDRMVTVVLQHGAPFEQSVAAIWRR
jgi:hypothetical protein